MKKINKMIAALKAFSFVLLLFFNTCAIAQSHSDQAQGPHIKVSLLSESEGLVPGSKATLGVLFEPDPEWHTYWRNPGDSGEAPAITWQTDSSLTFGEIQWPIPKAIPVAHLVNYGYEGANLLMVEVTIPDQQSLGNVVNIVADVSWLVCKEDCIPGWAILSLSLPIIEAPSKSQNSTVFSDARKKLPSPTVIEGHHEILDEHIALELNNIDAGTWQSFPFDSALIQHAAAQQVFNGDERTVRILIAKSDYFSGEAKLLNWLVSDGQQAHYAQTKLLVNATTISSTPQVELSIVELAGYMVMALIGGLILNLMPCVLPILSIKALALQGSDNAMQHKWSYLIGVIVSFNAFAAMIILLQYGGQKVGWGFHMQEPVVVILLTFLFTFIALSLLDALPVGAGLAGVGQSFVSGNSSFSHFCTGVLAVVVASPCTAPFMAVALGVALVSEPFVTLLIFNALGLGFALPITLLFVSQKLASSLPKPGPWMQTFKHALAFPMFLTVAWLCWVLAGQLGNQAQFALLLALVCFSMFLWIVSVSKSKTIRIVMTACALLSFGLPTYWLGFNSPLAANSTAKSVNSVPFNLRDLEQLKIQGQVVVVNMTADWCITCKVNEQVALSDTDVISAFNDPDVTYMVGDWTNKNAKILEYLSQYERAGVPLYVVYAGKGPKQVLTQILTPQIVLNAIHQAKQEQ